MNINLIKKDLNKFLKLCSILDYELDRLSLSLTGSYEENLKIFINCFNSKFKKNN